MRPRWNRRQKFRVGLLMAGSAILLVVLLTWFVGVSVGGQYDLYYLLLDENVKGLVVGSRVNFQGVPIGSVRDIRFQDGRTRVEFSCDPTRAVLQESTRARLDRAWVTGQVTVELEGYREGTPALEPGATIPPIVSPLVQLTKTLPDLTADLGALLTESRALAVNLNRVVSEPNSRRIEAILEAAEAAARTLPGELEATLAAMRGLASETREAVAALRRTADTADVGGVLAAVRGAAEHLEALERSALALVENMNGVVGTARSPLLLALTSARDTLAELRELARKLRAAPSSLLYGSRVNELAVPGAAPGGGR